MRPPTYVERVALWIPAPADWLTSNDRRGIYPSAALTKAWRQAAHLHGRSKSLHRTPVTTPVRITAYIHRAPKLRRDAPNAWPTLKAVTELTRDGLTVDEIAERVGVTRRTVNRIRARVAA